MDYDVALIPIFRSGGTGKGHPEQNPADSLACSGLRARLRLEQRLLGSKHGSRLWWLKLSSEILVERHLTGSV